MSTKDLFSGHAQVYAAFRPTYPDELYQFIFKHLKERSTAWDCATGNGQVARYLSKHFEKVYATDISQQQLQAAFQADNIFYSVSKAEQTSFKENQFDLITVGQALHWIDTEKFYNEVNRTARQQALLAVWGYSLLNIEPQIDELMSDFYKIKVGRYWDNARKLVDDQYRNIPFPFLQIEAPPFRLRVQWTIDHLAGYLTSWSATQKYITEKGENPVPVFIETIKPFWKEKESKEVTFPLFMKLGRINP